MKYLASMIQLAGVAALVTAAFLVDPTAGVAAGGGGLLFVGWHLERG